MEKCTPQFISYDFRDYPQKSGIGDIIAMNKAIATRRSYYCQYWLDLGRI